jgi:gliding motility-associated-like protein
MGHRNTTYYYRRAAVIFMMSLCVCSVVNLHAQTFTNLNVSAFEDLNNAKAYWVDFDNDGLLDLFVSGTNNSSSHKNTIYFNNGDDTFNSQSLASLKDIAVDFGDYDNDGFIDILLSGIDASDDKQFTVYKNNSGTAFVAQTFSFTDLSKGGLIWVDLDMDMDLDIVATGLDDSNDEQILLYEFDETSYNSVSNTMTAVGNGEIRAFDLDNDEKVELLITGLNSSGVAQTLIYTVDNNLNITLLGSQDGTAFNSLAMGDWNEDGYVDLAITGASGGSFDDASDYFANNQVNGFTKQANLLEPLSSSSVTFGDADNDGLLDMMLTGIDDMGTKYFDYYVNSSPGYNFGSTAISVENIYNGAAALGDFDNDGDLDLFQVGNSDLSFQANLYESDQQSVTVNNAPSAPSGLTSTVTEDSVYLSWTAGSDDLTAANSLTYAVYVSESSSAGDLVVSPLSNISTGYRKINKNGNAGYNKFKSFHNLPEGRYYWSVHTIDGSFKGSSFASEESFAVCYSFDIGNDTTICYNENVTVSAGDVTDVVNWYSKVNGTLLHTGNDYTHTVTEKDSIIAEVTKPFTCTVYDTIIIDVYDLPDFSLGNDTSLCFNENLELTISGFDSVNWYLRSNGSTAVSTDQESYNHLVTEKDTVIAEVFNINGCVNYDSIIVDVNDLPSFSLGNDTSICYNQEIDLTTTSLGIINFDSANWYTANNGEDAVLEDNTDYTHLALTKDTVILEVFNTAGCVNYDSIEIDIYELPNFSLGNDTSVCSGEDITLSVSDLGIVGLDSANWHLTGSTVNPVVENDEDYTYNNLTVTEEIIAEVYNSNGCVNYDTIIVSPSELPSFDLGSDTSVCYNESITISVADLGITDLDSTNWYTQNNGTGSILKNSESYTFDVLTKDTIIAEVFNTTGCVNYDSIIVDVIALPSFDLGSDTSICYNEEITISVSDLGITDLDSVNWYTTNNGSTAVVNDDEEYTHLTTEKDTVVAEVFNTSGCVSYDSIIVDVIALPDFSLGADTSICYNEDITLSVADLGITDLDSVNWYTSNNMWNTVAQNTYEHTLTILTKDTVVAEVFNTSGCVAYDTIIIDVDALPSFNLGNDTTVCYSEDITISVTDLGILNLDSVNWYTINNGSTAVSTDSEEYTHNVTTSDIIVSEVYNTSGCVNYDSIQIDPIVLPDFSLGDDQSICYLDSTELSVEDLGIVDLDSTNWYNQNGANLVLSNSFNYVHEVLELDTIVAEVFNASSCVNYDTIYIDKIDLPAFSLGYDTSICDLESIDFDISTLGVVNLDSANWYSISDGSSLLTSDSYTYNHTVVEDDILIAEVFNTSSCVNWDTINISKYDLPDFEIGNDTAICYQEFILLQTNSGFQEVNWYSKQTGEKLVSDNWFYNYEVLETDTLIAEVINFNNCVNYDTIAIEMIPLPVFDLGVDLHICDLDSVELNVGSGYSEVNWYTTGNQILESNSENYKFQVTEDITIWAEAFNSSGCVYYDTINIYSLELPEFDLGDDRIYCDGDSVIFDLETGANAFSWVNESNIEVATSEDLTYLADFSDKLTLTTTSDSACIYIDSVTITVNELPVFNIVGSEPICEGESAILSTSFPTWQELKWYDQHDTLIQNEADLLLTPASTTEVFLELKDENGCINYDSTMIVVNLLPAPNAGFDTLLCFDESLNLGEAPVADVSYSWSPTTYLDDPTSSNPTSTPDASIEYILTATTSEQCTASDTIFIEVNPEIVLDAGDSVSICIGDTIQIGGDPTASGSVFGYTYSWTPKNDMLNSDSSNPQVFPSSTTTYHLEVTSSRCSIEFDSITVTVNPLPEVTVAPLQNIGAGDEVEIWAEGGVTYQWSPQGTLDDPNVQNPIANPLTETTYEVIVTDENGCESAGEVTVLVNNQIFIPSLFTPNGDGNNDTFRVLGTGIKEIRLTVFDTEGNRVFSSDDITEVMETGWDGTSSGTQLKNDTYIWTIDGFYFNGSRIKFDGSTSGIIKLIR